MRAPFPIVLAALALAAAAPVAAASTVSVEAGVLVVAAAPGETNQVMVTLSPSSATGSYEVEDSAAATAGPGCFVDSQRSWRPIVCAAAGVQRIVVRLGDGNDRVSFLSSVPVPLELYGEAGRDDVDTASMSAPGTLVDGGDGDDVVAGSADIARGGPGDDTVIGARLVEGGEGDDVLIKSAVGAVPGKLDAGPGDDRLQAADGNVDELTCGEGRDVVVLADDKDRPDASCERGKGVAKVIRPMVTVFELPGGRSRPGNDGRLAVWMRCTVPACAVTVQIRSAGEYGTKRFVRFKPRQAPIQKLVVGTTASLVRLRLSSTQRRGLSRSRAYDGLSAKVTAGGPGGTSSSVTDGLFCTRKGPCGG